MSSMSGLNFISSFEKDILQKEDEIGANKKWIKEKI